MSEALPPLSAWRPLTVDEIVPAFSPLGVRWWVAGGIAVDLHLGRRTREHGDIDIAMLRGDCAALARLFDRFELYIAHDGALTPWHGEPLNAEHHQFWARRSRGEQWVFEVLLEQHDGDEWIYRRDPRVRCRAADFGLRDARGVPYVRPAIALLYKSVQKPDIEPSVRDRNEHDFSAALSALSEGERAWLRDGLQVTAPGHPWLARLGD